MQNNIYYSIIVFFSQIKKLLKTQIKKKVSVPKQQCRAFYNYYLLFVLKKILKFFYKKLNLLK